MSLAPCPRRYIRFPAHTASAQDQRPGAYVLMARPWCCNDLAECRVCARPERPAGNAALRSGEPGTKEAVRCLA